MSSNDDHHLPITNRFYPGYSGPERRAPDPVLEALREHERTEFAENEKRFDQLERELNDLKRLLSNINTGGKVLMRLFAIVGTISALVIAAWPMLAKH